MNVNTEFARILWQSTEMRTGEIISRILTIWKSFAEKWYLPLNIYHKQAVKLSNKQKCHCHCVQTDSTPGYNSQLIDHVNWSGSGIESCWRHLHSMITLSAQTWNMLNLARCFIHASFFSLYFEAVTKRSTDSSVVRWSLQSNRIRRNRPVTCSL